MGSNDSNQSDIAITSWIVKCGSIWIYLFLEEAVIFIKKIHPERRPQDKGCQCIEVVIVCEDLNLTTLPTLLVSQVSLTPYLSLKRNFIENITTGGMPSGLKGIDFRGNPIKRIDEDAFAGSEHTLYDLKFSEMNLDKLPSAFLHLDNLQHLSVANSQIRQWDDYILIHLGDDLQTLTLVDVGLSQWPYWIHYMSHLNTFEFSNSQELIPDNPFDQLDQVLSTITMRNISMTSTQNIFSNMAALKYLSLDNNLITEVTDLPNFGNLATINLNNNNITDRTNLSQALRTVARSLVTLYLNFNKLTTFPDLSFMTKLDSLYLTDNHISDTRFGSVPSAITILSLENNKISSISNFMRNGVNLQTVNLASNYITHIQGVDIPSSVNNIALSLNLITELRDNSFPQNSSLTVVSFDYNPISVISPGAFANLKQLIYLTIKGSKLSRLPPAIGLLNSLKTLDMRGTVGLVCTCQEKSLRQWALSVSTEISGDCGITSIDYFLKTLAVGCSD